MCRCTQIKMRRLGNGKGCALFRTHVRPDGVRRPCGKRDSETAGVGKRGCAMCGDAWGDDISGKYVRWLVHRFDAVMIGWCGAAFIFAGVRACFFLRNAGYVLWITCPAWAARVQLNVGAFCSVTPAAALRDASAPLYDTRMLSIRLFFTAVSFVCPVHSLRIMCPHNCVHSQIC